MFTYVYTHVGDTGRESKRGSRRTADSSKESPWWPIIFPILATSLFEILSK